MVCCFGKTFEYCFSTSCSNWEKCEVEDNPPENVKFYRKGSRTHLELKVKATSPLLITNPKYKYDKLGIPINNPNFYKNRKLQI